MIGGTFVENVPIPAGATSAKASDWDSDLLSNDLIWKATIPSLGSSKTLTIRAPWTCIGEEVAGPAGRSHSRGPAPGRCRLKRSLLCSPEGS